MNFWKIPSKFARHIYIYIITFFWFRGSFWAPIFAQENKKLQKCFFPNQTLIHIVLSSSHLCVPFSLCWQPMDYGMIKENIYLGSGSKKKLCIFTQAIIIRQLVQIDIHTTYKITCWYFLLLFFAINKLNI